MKKREKIINTEDEFNDLKYSGYLFHYTDAMSALNILLDDRILPYSQERPNETISLTKLSPNTNDITLIKYIYNLSDFEIDNTDLRKYFGKMHYAFGFRINDVNLLNEINEDNLENKVYNLINEIDLVPIKFILVQRSFRFTTRDEYEANY